MKMIRPGLLLLILAICFSVSGCGRNQAEKLVAESKEVNSWAASAQMIAAAWAEGKVPTAYAQRSFETITKQLSESATRTESLSDNDRARLTVTVQLLLHLLSELEAAAKQQDRSAINHIVAQLSGARNALNSVSRTRVKSNEEAHGNRARDRHECRRLS